MKELEKIELKAYVTWLDEDNIVWTVVKEKANIDLEDAKENSIVVNGLIKSGKSPLVDTRSLHSITKDARDHFSMKGRDTNVSSIAIIVGSALSRMVANFYLGINKPKVPVRLFNNDASAIKWSKSF